MGHSLVI